MTASAGPLAKMKARCGSTRSEISKKRKEERVSRRTEALPLPEDLGNGVDVGRLRVQTVEEQSQVEAIRSRKGGETNLTPFVTRFKLADSFELQVEKLACDVKSQIDARRERLELAAPCCPSVPSSHPSPVPLPHRH